MRWEVLKSDIIYRCRIFSVRRDHSRSLQSGLTHDFHVIETGDWVNVIPLTADARVIMVRQFRHGIRDLTLEVPAGFIDDADASPSAAALRELREETGCVSHHIAALGVVHPNPALMNNRCHMFVAYEVEVAGAPRCDSTEEIAVETVRLDEIPELVRSGSVSNALTVVAFQLLQLAQGQPVT